MTNLYPNMVMRINEDCIVCGWCSAICPCPDVIQYEPNLDYYYVLSFLCNLCDCTLECQDVCPVNALEWDIHYPPRPEGPNPNQ